MTPLPWWFGLMLAAAGGVAGMFAFPRYSWWWLAPISLLCLALAVRGRSGASAAVLGFVHGLAMLVPLLSWTGIQVGPFPWLALAAMEAGFHALGGLGLALTQRFGRRPVRLVGTAAVWVGVEAAQGRIPFGGFAWSKLAFTQADAPTLGLAALGGAPLVTFAVGLIASATSEAVAAATNARRRQGQVGRLRAGAPVVGCLTLAVVALGAGAAVPVPTAADSGALRVAGIQGSVPKMGLEFNAKRRAVLDKHAALTRQLAADVAADRTPQPDLVVWPENSSDIDPYANDDAYRVIDAAVSEAKAPTLIGTLVRSSVSGLYRNTALLWQPGVGPTASYAKRAPVPFAEYVPYRDFFRAITPLVDRAGNFEAGDSVGVLDVPVAGGTATVGVLICFEVVPDRLVRDVVNAGAQLLIVPTNNATFGFTDESRQQLAISRLRAVESGRAVVHVSTVGVSGLIAPDGTVVDGSPLFSATILTARLPLRQTLTVATRVGAWPEALITLVALAVAAAGLVGTRRDRSPRGRRPLARRPDRGQPVPMEAGT